MLKQARALGALIAAVILLYGADLALLTWRTSDPMIVRVDAANPPAPSSAAAAEAGPTSGEQAAAQEQLYQSRAYDGLATWAQWTTGLTALALLGWFAVALWRERRTFGPARQTSAFPYWIALVGAYVIGAAAAYVWLIKPMGLFRYIDAFDLYLLTGAVGLLGAAALWIASILGIGPVLRPSVPLGARFS